MYAELHCHSNFSFLDGASHPGELARRAGELELPALAITDTGGVYGAVRFHRACREAGVHPVIGTSLEVDGRDLVLLARTQAGYTNLSRLLSLAHRDQPKGEARTTLETLARHGRDLACLTATEDEPWLASLQDALGGDGVFVRSTTTAAPRTSGSWSAARPWRARGERPSSPPTTSATTTGTAAPCTTS